MSDFNYKNLIFEGGGVKGLAYIGALRALNLDEFNVLKNIKRIGGTSAGAITALLVGLGFTPDEIRTIIDKRNLEEIEDSDKIHLLDTVHLLSTFGWHKGKVLRKWLTQAIEHKTGNPNSTFQDLIRLKEEDKEKNIKELYFIGTNLASHSSKIFCAELTPDFPLIDAVLISASIPLFFPPVIKEKVNFYVDGGVLVNYPIRLFDEEGFMEIIPEITTNKYSDVNTERVITNITGTPYYPNNETLGFRLDSTEEIHLYTTHEAVVYKIDNLYDFTKHLIHTLMDYQNHTHLDSTDKNRTIYLNTLDVKATDFDIPPEKKNELIERAFNDTKSWLENSKKPQPIS